jgi:hypothetical protein
MTLLQTYHIVSWIDGSNWISLVSTSCNVIEPIPSTKSSSSKSLNEPSKKEYFFPEQKQYFTLLYYFFDHSHNYQHHEIDMQLNVHNEPVLVPIQPWYNVHPNDKENKSKIVFHRMKNQFHRIKHDIKLVVMFLLKHQIGTWSFKTPTYLE